MKKFRNAALIVLVLATSIILILGFTYKNKIGPVSKDDKLVVFKIPQGATIREVGKLLEQKGLIKDEKYFYLYVKFNDIKNLEAARYKLAPNMGVKKIIETIQEGGVDREEVKITFREGLNMRAIARVIEKNTANTYDDVFNLLKDKEYIDKLIETYWFLTDEVKNDKIYYPLEGYLFPETYIVYDDSSVKEIFQKMLSHTSKILSKYKTQIEESDYSAHEILTLASIIELESSSSQDSKNKVSGVFYNRMNKGMTLGSDVTGYYGAKMDDWTKGLGSHVNDCNGYNTRGTCVKGLPVGPVCNPGERSVKAALNPSVHSYYFFVADCDGKTYLTKTNSEHENMIAKLRKAGKWCDK